MDGGALFRVRTDARARVKEEMRQLALTKNDVGGYEYNAAITLIKQINRVLEQQLFEETADGMVGLGSEHANTLTAFKSNIAIKKSDVKQQSIAEAAANSTTSNTLAPEITSNTDAQEEADRQNTARLAAIGVKEAIAAGITAIVGDHITNPILRTADGTDFKTVDEYELHQLLTAIKEGAERPSAAAIREMMVTVIATEFDWRESAATNFEKLSTAAAKAATYGITIDNSMKGLIVAANVASAAQQTWGTELAEAQRKIKAQYSYNHVHDSTSIKVMMKLLAAADEQRNRKEAAAPDDGEKANLVGMGIDRLQQLLQNPSDGYASESAAESALAATSDSESSAERSRHRGRERKREKKERKQRRRSPSPSTSRTPSPPRRSRGSKSRRSKSRKPAEKDINPTKCKYCKEFGGYGMAHAAPKSIPHSKCNYNKKWKGWRPEWVCKKIGIEYKEHADCDD